MLDKTELHLSNYLHFQWMIGWAFFTTVNFLDDVQISAGPIKSLLS